ncbi:MAG: replication-associated recombination protein A [Dehalococcoidia bacterium]|nr:MAG: replication-associated recombination protein A [Dehalococcoidia bacterium]
MFDQQFEKLKETEAPLAARMRPGTLDTFVGQEHLVGPGHTLRKAIESGQLPSIILWGTPGSGKTTLAFIIANSSNSYFAPVSAVSASVGDLRRIIEEAKERRKLHGQKTILFIDEIHRFNKAQQDAILPYVEDGTVTLIGATTENPSFEVISPLLSRARVYKLNPLSEHELQIIITRALKDRLKGLGALDVSLSAEALRQIITISNNDARIALNTLEIAALTTQPGSGGSRLITLQTVEDVSQHRALRYDKGGEQHYDTISALHKSMRDSDPDAAIYWLSRMLESGEDPLFIARRVARAASEDVGMADPQALVVAMAAQQAVHFIGMPEANLALAEAVVYIATAPKSNSLYRAYSTTSDLVKKTPDQEVPLHLRNPVTPLVKKMGYGKGYQYAHNEPNRITTQEDLPPSLAGKTFYIPGDQGFEKILSERLQGWQALRKAKRAAGESGDDPDHRPPERRKT